MEGGRIIPLAKPKVGSAGVTGTWRVFRPVVDTVKCVKCGLCWLYCPEVAIEPGDDGRPRILYDYCKGCGICANECPVKAIKMVKE